MCNQSTLPLVSSSFFSVISNALVALGAVALSVGMSLPFNTLQLFIDFPEDDPELAQRTAEYANSMTSVSHYMMAMGGLTVFIGSFVGVIPDVRQRKFSRNSVLIIIAAVAIVLGILAINFGIVQPYIDNQKNMLVDQQQ